MQEQYHVIGETAGKIYKALETNGKPMAPSAVAKEAGLSEAALFNQALGWLAREGKLSFEKKGPGWQIALASAPANSCCR